MTKTQPPVDAPPQPQPQSPELDVEYTYDGLTYRLSSDVAVRLERALDDFFMSEAGDPDIEDQPPTPSGVYYCGCSVCSTRETLVITAGILLAAVRDGLAEIAAP